MAKDGENERQALVAAAPSHDTTEFCDDCYDEMATASNAVLHLIDAGKLDEAERAAHDLLQRFPDVPDGYARLGLIYEVRGENQQAIEYYRKVIAFAREHADRCEPVFAEGFQELIDRLERPPAG